MFWSFDEISLKNVYKVDCSSSDSETNSDDSIRKKRKIPLQHIVGVVTTSSASRPGKRDELEVSCPPRRR